ncbi:Mov34/MPN/PAD-1 family protein [Vagococcus carniphilus]|uniref:JAB domain-containing protein n=1 Tax=Vagococcus carniphilus TaxID=218144 RepID=A0A430B6K8_9ENTE|nr:Mov34/MPN/PAD-1 family protein [Vagococcus carniphilus]MDT2815254.1 Mov34/MPN/PAD-1 family protein [Vagococcus carniphilus]MDT2866509.1 Mov34/MPN/PAD-1 family protein [Vagococcus carniphilus]QNN72847.1 Mov34/MPN/PAD-1 family protein [Vagococcus carniphilus]RSU15954.1 hypothetical protein CBF28_05865 [Vagococcus carniphilus]
MLKIIIPSNIKILIKEQLISNGENEIGGTLLAEKIGNNSFKIKELTTQKRSGTKVFFVREWTIGLNRYFHNFFKRTNHEYSRFNYIGEWHSHPLFEVHPSQTDISTMNDLINFKIPDANFLILLIVKLDSNQEIEASVTCFLKNGYFENAELKWED